MDQPTDRGAALDAGRRFLDGTPRDAHVVVFCHFDADGLSAGALLARALPRLGFGRVTVVPSGRAEPAFSDGARERLRGYDPDVLVVADLGIRPDGVLVDVPTLYLDHHQPLGPPPGPGVAVSGYPWDPSPNTSWLAHDLLEPMVSVDDLLWVSALGTLSDYGPKAPWPGLAEARRRHTLKWLQECVVLLNAARRASAFDTETPLRLLVGCDGPRELAEGGGEDTRRLRAYRAEVQRELAIARRVAPIFSETEPFALLAIRSGCQIHPLIAQQWSQRLPKYAAIAANHGYLPDRVAFSVRTRRKDLDLPRILRAIDVGGHTDAYGHGHDQASGGHLPADVFPRVLAALGFGELATG